MPERMGRSGIYTKVHGIPDVKRRLRMLGKRAERELGDALWRRGNALIGKILRDQDVPIDTGTLRNSNYVDRPRKQVGSVMVVVGFGGPAVEYAIYVHENLEARHFVGRAKYLTGPAMEQMGSWPREIAADLDAALERAA